MRNFLKRIIVFFAPLILVFGIFIAIVLLCFDSKIDSSYSKISRKHPEGLIIGTSRAAQALEPSVFGDVYNFAFTQAYSPFDSSYFELIKRFHPISVNRNVLNKSDNFSVKQDLKLHLICVDAWSLSSFPGDKYERMNTSFVNETEPGWIDGYNFEYLFKHMPTKWSEVIENCISSNFVNPSGRFVVSFTFDQMQDNFNRSFPEKMIYNKKKEIYRFGSMSNIRLYFLKKTISYLKQDGKIVLVQLPVHRELAALEDKFAPNFDSLIKKVAQKEGIQFINLKSFHDSVHYTDGGHIWNGDALKISQMVKRRIN